MNSQQLTDAETELKNLHRLLEADTNDGFIKDEQIATSDLMFFSLETELPGIGSNFQNFSEIDNNSTNTNNEYHVHSEDGREFSTTNNTIRETNLSVKNEAVESLLNEKFNKDGKVAKIFECRICNRQFGHQYTLTRHLTTHTNERKFRCYTCDKAFRQMSTLIQHKAIHSSDRPYVCEVCSKNFNRVSTLISHKKTHTGVKPHKCHLCDKAFHQKGNLRNHIFTHTKERPYKCDVCEKGFNQMSNLTCHKLKSHHNENYVLPQYDCKICGEIFSKRVSLRQHEQFSHNMDNSQFRDLASAIIVDPIQTEAMKSAIASGFTPFALLRPLSGIPVLVRVHPAGDKQMLLPATAEDLKNYGHISMRPKVAKTGEDKENQDSSKTKGSIVQIKVPVVATVIQKTSGTDGTLSMRVQSPGRGEILDQRGGNMADLNVDSFVYTSSLIDINNSGIVNVNNNEENIDDNNSLDNFTFNVKYDHLIGNLTDSNEIELIDEAGNPVEKSNVEVNSIECNLNNPQDYEVINCATQENTNEISYIFDMNFPQMNSSLEFVNSEIPEENKDFIVLPFEF